MSCCGKARAQASMSSTAQRDASRGQQSSSRTVAFEYAGNTPLTVIGPATGRTYHFSALGGRVYVDSRDSGPLATIRMLRRV
jgi:hypothetical protein